MTLPWPAFWQHIREDDRAALSDILTQLLASGALLGDGGRERELFLLARHYQTEIAEYFAPLNLELVPDPDRPILQLRPVPGDCGLTARFNKAETLLVLTLWRIYHDARMEQAVAAVVITAHELWSRLKLYFDRIDPPTEALLRDILAKLRGRRLIRTQRQDDGARFADLQIEILPTLARAIPFEDAAAWEQQRSLHAAAAGAESAVLSVPPALS
jgi:hypothetical protein